MFLENVRLTVQNLRKRLGKASSGFLKEYQIISGLGK